MELIHPDWPAPRGVRALVTTRAGGVSSGPYAGLNLGSHCGDQPQAVLENRRRLASLLPAAPVWLRQVHGSAVLRADEWADGSDPSCAEPEADAAIATRTGVVCAVMVADCLPILLCSERSETVAAIHAGWRGLSAGVIENTLDLLGAPESLLAWFGPAIGARSYEVGGEVRAAFIRRDPDLEKVFAPARPGHWLLDLYAAARSRLQVCGVRSESIYGGGFCTRSDARRFFSYRRDGVTGRVAALIWRESKPGGRANATKSATFRHLSSSGGQGED